MSRSYRNRHSNKICRDYMKSSHHGKYYKRYANKRARKHKCLINGCMYKKIYDSWNIHDYSYHVSNLPEDWKNHNWCRYFMCK